MELRDWRSRGGKGRNKSSFSVFSLINCARLDKIGRYSSSITPSERNVMSLGTILLIIIVIILLGGFSGFGGGPFYGTGYYGGGGLGLVLVIVLILVLLGKL